MATDDPDPTVVTALLAHLRALLEHDPTLRPPDTFAGREALRLARFHKWAEVLTLIDLVDQEQNSVAR
jgi:hypothetical protein